MNRIIIAVLTIMSTSFVCNAQSAALKQAFNNVYNTLTEYDFDLGYVGYGLEDNQCVSQKFSVYYSHPNIVFSFKEIFHSGCWFDDHDKPDELKIIIDITQSKIEIIKRDRFDDSKKIEITNPSGIIISHNGKKGLHEEYSIYSYSNLNLQKLYNELIELQRLIISENYQGSLGKPTQKKTSNSSTPKEPKSKKAGRYEQ